MSGGGTEALLFLLDIIREANTILGAAASHLCSQEYLKAEQFA